MKPKLIFIFLLIAIPLGMLSACSEGPYYLQAIKGQAKILSSRQPIKQLLADQTLPPKRREQLERILQIRDFASTRLGLPDNASYRSYVELDRPYALWNVVAAPPLSLQAKTWCFPIAGCVSYRGYFSKQAAEQFAQTLQQQQFDTLVAGVPAYSTLSWFDDPVLSSFSAWPAPALARLLIHELAHQQLYLKGDSAFSEAFATSVEIAGTRVWLKQYGTAADQAWFSTRLKREARFVAWTNQLHRQLKQLYASTNSDQQKLQEKKRIIAAAQQEYQRIKQEWGGYGGYDNWVKTLNNARLVSLQTYRRLLPAFNHLLAQNHGNFRRYYQACAKLAALPRSERRERIARLQQAPTLAENQKH